MHFTGQTLTCQFCSSDCITVFIIPLTDRFRLTSRSSRAWRWCSKAAKREVYGSIWAWLRSFSNSIDVEQLCWRRKERKIYQFQILWNHFNLWGSMFVDKQNLTGLLGHNFMYSKFDARYISHICNKFMGMQIHGQERITKSTKINLLQRMLIPQYRTRTLLLQIKLNMEVNFIDIHVDTLPGTRQGRDWLTVDHTVRSIPQAPKRYYQQCPTNHKKGNVRSN